MPIDYKDYHPEWKTRIRPDILKRADNKCEFCDIPNYSTNVRGTKVILTISHQDHNKDNNDYENLKALCQACHLKYDMDRHVANRKRNQEAKKNKSQLTLIKEILPNGQ